MTVVARIALRSAARNAATALLEDYASLTGFRLNVYRGRPRSIMPPHAFVEGITTELSAPQSMLRQRVATVEIILVHGLFDSGEAVDQADDFCDGFDDYVWDNPHAMSGRTVTVPPTFESLPNYVPDWLPPERQQSYYATRITLEGLSLDN